VEILAQSSANFALTLLFGHSYIMGASRGGPCDSTAIVFQESGNKTAETTLKLNALEFILRLFYAH